MKRLLIVAVLVFGILNVLLAQGTVNPNLMQAVLDGIGSVTLSDAQVVAYSRQAVQQMDATNPVANASDPYSQRLSRIVRRHRTVGGLPINYKVYNVSGVNAFATADGSVRVFKGLMDVMTDNELLAIMGHEIGHVINRDTRDAMKRGLQRSALRNAGASQSGMVGKLSRSQVAGAADYIAGASFSRQQETEADDYGYGFLKRNGYSVMALATSFEKLAKLGGGGGNRITAFLSSHPDSRARAERVRARARRDGLAR
ncbi:M48 family metalloprotease [Spirosoma arcticum]